MIFYLLKKTVGLAPLFLGITLVSFIVIHLAPGSPTDIQAELNPKVSPEAREKLDRLYGLDKPLHEQYAAWLGRFVRLDFGESFVDGRKVIQKIGDALPATILINSLSLFFIFLVGVPLGVLGAVHKGKPLDRFIAASTLAAYSLPAFWLALLLLSFFGVTLRVLPISGLHSLFYEEMGFWKRAADLVWHLILPVLVSSITWLAVASRTMRKSMRETLGQNYVRTARAKGLPEGRVLYKHALRNALLPVITLLGLSIPALVGGSVIFESIFSIPGMGRLFYQSVFARDYPVIMGVLVLGAFLTLLGNLLAVLNTSGDAAARHLFEHGGSSEQ